MGGSLSSTSSPRFPLPPRHTYTHPYTPTPTHTYTHKVDKDFEEDHMDFEAFVARGSNGTELWSETLHVRLLVPCTPSWGLDSQTEALTPPYTQTHTHAGHTKHTGGRDLGADPLPNGWTVRGAGQARARLHFRETNATKDSRTDGDCDKKSKENQSKKIDGLPFRQGFACFSFMLSVSSFLYRQTVRREGPQSAP